MFSMALSEAREWKFAGIPKPLEADFVGMEQGAVVLRGPNGKSFEVPLANFSPEDQRYIRNLDAGIEQSTNSTPASGGKPITSRRDYKTTTAASLSNQVVALNAPMELHVTGPDDPISGSTFLFTSPEAWLFLDQIPPSIVASRFLKRMKVNGADADMEKTSESSNTGAAASSSPMALTSQR